MVNQDIIFRIPSTISLSYLPIAGKRHHDQGDLWKKRVYGGLLAVPEGEPMTIIAENMASDGQVWSLSRS